MLSFKNPVFKEEQEWRLITARKADHKANQLQFHEKNHGLIPYIEANIMEVKEHKIFFPLRSLKFGPMLDESSTRSAIRLFVQRESTSDCHIKIPDGITITSAGYYLR